MSIGILVSSPYISCFPCLLLMIFLYIHACMRARSVATRLRQQLGLGARPPCPPPARRSFASGRSSTMDEDPERYFEAACEEQAEKEQTFAELLQDDAADFVDSQLHLDSNFSDSFAVLLPLLETPSAGSSEASALTPHFLFSHCFFRTDASPQKLILHRLYLYDHARVSSMSKFPFPMLFYFSVMDINFECAVRKYSRKFSCVFSLLPFFFSGYRWYENSVFAVLGLFSV